MTDRPYPDGIAWDEAWRQRQRADAWRKAARLLYDTCTLGTSRGRPMDLIPRRDWQYIIHLIQEATDIDDGGKA